MITPREEYLSNLVQIQRSITADNYFPIPEAEKIYKIDLNSRIVEAPPHLSVTDDHEAEILFFEVDRFFDKKDLLQATCVITYINAVGESHLYPIPCMDAITKRSENKILLPWVISSDVTWGAGTVKFAFKFYEINDGTFEYLYALNTTVATTKVLQGIKIKYIDATELAAAAYRDGNWDKLYDQYFIKITNTMGSERYQKATRIYDSTISYYQRDNEFNISDASKLEILLEKMDKIENKATLKWIELN